MKLDVCVNARKVASLFREADEFILLYEPGVAPEQLVSLAMPVRARPWVWPRDLHPFFRQNLPEGYLLGILREQFSTWLDGTDFSLLALVGGSGIGRVTIVPKGKTDTAPVTAFDVASVLHGDNNEATFEALVRKHALQAVSGVFPKFLEPAAQPPAIPTGRTTLRNGTHLIKGSGARTPFLAMNEHYSLEALRRTQGMPVVSSQLSDDGRVLAVSRFDVDNNGEPLCALEDVCGLLGLPPHEKYAATTEQAIKVVRSYLAPDTLQSDLEHLGWLIISSYVLRNADLHTKNIALRYTHAGDVRLAPAYDIVTTQAYPDYALNPPGLSVAGRKSWVAGKNLQHLFSSRLNIAPRRYHEMVETMCDAATDTGRLLLQETHAHPEWRPIAAAMLHAWNDGMEHLRSEKSRPALRALENDLKAECLDEKEKPTKATVIGKSELMKKDRPF